jgi:hypothetical protein
MPGVGFKAMATRDVACDRLEILGGASTVTAGETDEEGAV